MTCYLDRKALAIAETMVPILRDALGPKYDVSDADTDSPYASEQGDRGAWIAVSRDGTSVADVRVEIHDSAGYDGPGLGWGFGLACTSDGGRIGPGGIIGNYSEHVWTRDRTEIRSRLAQLASGADDHALECADWIRSL